MSNYVIGVDLGTSGIKAGVVDECGKVLSSQYWATKMVASGPGRMEQSPETYYQQALQIIAEVVRKAGVDARAIQGLAFDGQMGGVIGIDRTFEAVTGLDMGLDIRSENYNELLHRDHGDLLSSISCGSPRNTPKIMWWMTEHPDVYARVAKFVTLNGFVAGKMAGLNSDDAFLDYTLLSFFGNEDARALAWSDEISEVLHLDLGRFPRVVRPWETIGKVSPVSAPMCGLREGTPIVAGAGDQPAGLLGAGLVRPGVLSEVSGSSTLLFQCVEQFRPDLDHRTVMYIPSIRPNQYHAFTYINGGGVALNWFMEQMLCMSSEEGFKKLTSAASKLPPGSEGLIFLPYFGGRQCPYNRTFRGGWVGLNWGHRKEHLFRAMLEALSYDHALGAEHIHKLFAEFTNNELCSYGGGSRNELWNQIKADVLGIPVRRLNSYHFAIVGSALIAEYGLGISSDLCQFTARNPESEKVYYPDPSRTKTYRGFYRIFADLLSSGLEDVFSRIYQETSRSASQ